MILALAAGLLALAGCKSTATDTACCTPDATNAAAMKLPEVVAPMVSAPTNAPTAEEWPLPPVRIKAGPSPKFTDAEGNVWITDRGFLDGDIFERPEVNVANTTTPGIYRSERFSMSAFSYPVPNGKYVVKLHFAETYEGIEGPGGRVFSFNVKGVEFADFDVWVKAGGPMKAYVETVPVEVKDGKLDITFTPKEQNPEINGIEILPGE